MVAHFKPTIQVRPFYIIFSRTVLNASTLTNGPYTTSTLLSRYQYMDGELGIVVEPETLPEDIYPFSLVDDADNNVRGSCSSYSTRTPVGKEEIMS